MFGGLPQLYAIASVNSIARLYLVGTFVETSVDDSFSPHATARNEWSHSFFLNMIPPLPPCCMSVSFGWSTSNLRQVSQVVMYSRMSADMPGQNTHYRALSKQPSIPICDEWIAFLISDLRHRGIRMRSPLNMMPSCIAISSRT